MSHLDWRALAVEGDDRSVIYAEAFPKRLNDALAETAEPDATLAAFDTTAAREILPTFAGAWGSLHREADDHRWQYRCLVSAAGEGMVVVLRAVALDPDQRWVVVTDCDLISKLPTGVGRNIGRRAHGQQVGASCSVPQTDRVRRSIKHQVPDQEEMEASHRLTAKCDPTAGTMRYADLIPNRIVLRQRVEHGPEIMTTEVVDATRWKLGFDVVQRRIPESYRPHERRVARSAAA